MARLALGVLLLVSLIVYASTQGPLFRSVTSLPVVSLIEITIVYILSQTVSAFKWMLILRSLNQNKTFWECLRAYFLGMYVNSFGLGIVGGDAVRALSVNAESKKSAIISVIFDRFHGFLVLSALGSVCGFIYAPGLDRTHLFVPFLLMAIALAGVAAIFLSAKLERLHWPEKWQNYKDVLLFASSLKFGEFVKVSVISVVFHLLQLMALWLFSRHYGVELSPYYWISVMALVNIVSTLPISWNGLGIREALLMLYMTPQPLDATMIIAFSLIWLFAIICGSLLGAIMGIFQGFNLKGQI